GMARAALFGKSCHFFGAPFLGQSPFSFGDSPSRTTSCGKWALTPKKVTPRNCPTRFSGRLCERRRSFENEPKPSLDDDEKSACIPIAEFYIYGVFSRQMVCQTEVTETAVPR